MAHKAANGFIAPKPTGAEFCVTETRHNGKHVEHEPTGIFAHGDHRVGVFMNYAGLDNSAWSTFILPTEPAFLREISDAILLMAEHIEKASGR